jgi:hypothetical protein
MLLVPVFPEVHFSPVETNLSISLTNMLKIQAGPIIFDSRAVGAAVSTVLTNYSALVTEHPLPKELYAHFNIFTIPGLGKTAMIGYLWNGPESAESKLWVERLSSLAPVMQVAVASTKAFAYVDNLTKLLVPCVYRGTSKTTNLKGLVFSSTAISTLADCAEAMPQDGGCLISIHSVHRSAETSPQLPSVFMNREDHFMVEIVGMGVEVAAAELGKPWAEKFGAQLDKAEGAMDSVYAALVQESELNLDKIYRPSDLEELRALKKEVDPNGVFNAAAPQF